MHPKTQRKYCGDMDVKPIDARRKPKARAVAERDPRNVFTFAAGVHALMFPNLLSCPLAPSMVRNIDATKIAIGEKRIKVWATLKSRRNKEYPIVKKGNQQKVFTTECFTVMVADGTVDTLVFVLVAEKDMVSGSFLKVAIRGLSPQ